MYSRLRKKGNDLLNEILLWFANALKMSKFPKTLIGLFENKQAEATAHNKITGV